MYKYIDIERLEREENEHIFNCGSDELIVEEKVDGGNASFFVEDNNVVHECSRNRDLTNEQENERTFINERKYLREILAGKTLNPDYIYYDEWMQKHTLTYVNPPKFIGFDICVKENKDKTGVGLFISYDATKKEYDRLGIEMVPLLWRGPVHEFIKKNPSELITKSKYGDTLMEGIVIKNYNRLNVWGRQMFGKVVREEFKEQNRATFGKIKQTPTDSLKIIEEFCTDARIDKKINELLLQDNWVLSRNMMKELPMRVLKDIFKEEYSNIVDNYKLISISELKGLMAKKCLFALDRKIEEATKNE